MRILVSIALLSTIGLFQCNPNNIPRDLPSCVKDLIRSKPSQPLEVWQYQYQNETVYLTIPDCCDQYVSVYSSQCVMICAPSGGITGRGDGKCPDFYKDANQGELIWKAE
jgi:hypothetical protein